MAAVYDTSHVALPIRSANQHYYYKYNFLILDTSLSTSKELNGQSIIPPTIGINSLAATADNILGNSSNDLLKIKIRQCYTLCILTNDLIAVSFHQYLHYLAKQ